MWTPALIIETFERGVSISECLHNLESKVLTVHTGDFCVLFFCCSNPPCHVFRSVVCSLACQCQAKKLVGDAALKSFLQMILVDNLIHSDLHPGNILVQFSKPVESSSSVSDYVRLSLEDFGCLVDEGDMSPQPMLVYLDVGLTTTLSPENLYVPAFFSLFLFFVFFYKPSIHSPHLPLDDWCCLPVETSWICSQRLPPATAVGLGSSWSPGEIMITSLNAKKTALLMESLTLSPASTSRHLTWCASSRGL